MKRMISLIVISLIAMNVMVSANDKKVLISAIQENYKSCANINLTYLSGRMPAVVPIITEKVISLDVTGEVLKIVFKDKKETGTYELYQSLNSITNVSFAKNEKKGDTMTVFFGDSKFSKELAAVVDRKFKESDIFTYMNSTTGTPVPVKKDKVKTFAIQGDLLHYETTDSWSVWQALSGLNYALFLTKYDPKKDVTTKSLTLFNFGPSTSETITQVFASKWKDCNTITSLGVPLPPISIADIKEVLVNSGVVILNFKNDAFIRQSITSAKNITIRPLMGLNNMILTF